MRPNVILITIVLGGMISGAVFFIFGYPVGVPDTNLAVQPPSDGQQAFLLPVSETNYSPVRDFNVPEPVIEAKAAALFDVGSGRFLFTQNVNKRLPIASITKLMTAIVVLENLNLEQVFTVPVETINVDGNGADLYRDEQLRVSDLLKIMLVNSSNDAALTLTTETQNGQENRNLDQGISSGETTEAQKGWLNLVEKMNEKARMLGMFNTKFTDPAGLDDYDAFSTASDLIKLVRYAESYELISKTLQEKSADVSSVDGRIKHHLINTNQLLGQIPGIVLGKTGFTDGALGTMVLGVNIGSGSNLIISVLLGSIDRFGETKKLIEWGKRAYSWE